MSALVEIRKRLKDTIRQAHPAFQDVDLHYGRLEPDEIRKITAFPPAARVGIFGPVRSDFLPTGELKLNVRFAAVALTRSGDLLESMDQALDLATAMAATVAGWMPGVRILDGDDEIAPALPNVGLPEAISIEPSPSAELEAEGIALWGCLFTVPVVVGLDLANAEASFEITLDGLDPYFDDEGSGP